MVNSLPTCSHYMSASGESSEDTLRQQQHESLGPTIILRKTDTE